MQIYDAQDGRRVSISSGEFHVTGEDRVIISTVLGSCVSVCLFDPVAGIAGMNHFMLSNHRYAKKMPMCLTEAGRYGIYAMELLINEMLRRGAQRKDLVAKAFGGGSVLKGGEHNDNFFCVGHVNAKFIVEFLDVERIRLAAQDLGGEAGRVVHFHTKTFKAKVKKILPSASEEIMRNEWHLWKSEVNARKNERCRVEIWG